MENLALDIATRVQWSSWSRCESSFSMLLVPHRPGIYALAEEVADSPHGKRILALFHVAESHDLSYEVMGLFSRPNPIRDRLEEGRCHLRYTLISDPEDRAAVLNALHAWMVASREQATGIAASGDFAEAANPPHPTRPPAAEPTPINVHKRPGITERPIFPAGF
jgi:hypothetical protein